MMSYMISMFIDDELEVKDKMEFVEKVHRDKAYKDETIELLHQEELIRSEVVYRIPSLVIKARERFVYPLLRPLLRPIGLLASAVVVVLIIWFFSMPSQVSTSIPHRFVIYQPTATEVEITGSFTQWAKIAMNKVGSSGYWVINLEVPQGEHRFTYILDGHRGFADPTILTRERDDFGGENSILLV